MLRFYFRFTRNNHATWKYNYMVRNNWLWFCSIVCFFVFGKFSIDNSDFMRDRDFIPTRMQAQQDAVSLIFHAKTRSNPENNVGLLTLSE